MSGTDSTRVEFLAVPALPAEQQDPHLNPSRGPLGWVVIRTRDDAVVHGRIGLTFMEHDEAQSIADELNRR